MRGRALVVLLLLTACARSTAPNAARNTANEPSGSLIYRVMAERTVADPCVPAPQFGIAQDENHWIDVFDMETACNSKETTIPLPDVDFDTEVAVGAWWESGVCQARKARIVSVARAGENVVVRADTGGAPACSGPAEAETFFAIQHSDLYDGTQPISFILDGRTVGTAKPGGI